MKEETIRFRCSSELRAKLEHLAQAHEQTLSDYIRIQLLRLVQSHEPPKLLAVAEDQAAWLTQELRAGATPQKHSAHNKPPTPPKRKRVARG